MSDYRGGIKTGNNSHIGDNYFGYNPNSENAIPKIVTLNAAPEPSVYFTGRETELTEIKKFIEGKHRVVVLNGYGGIGKSEICKNLFAEYKKADGRFKHIGWVVFDENMKKTLSQKFSPIEEDNFEENFKQTQKFINGLADELLLFIDNMDDFSKDDIAVLDALACKIIITSRNKQFGNKKILPIGALSERECFELYAEIVERDCDEKIVREIARKADCLTLVVELLANTAKTAFLSDVNLLKKLNEKGFDLSEIPNKVKDDKKFNEMLSSLFKLSQINPSELLVLKQFSLFPPQVLEFKYVKKWFLFEGVDPDILNNLANKGWLKRNAVGFGMHPVIAGVVGYENQPSCEDCEELVDMLGRDLNFEDTEIFTSRLGILPFGEKVAEYFIDKSVENENVASLIHRVAYIYDEQGEYEKAFKFYEKSAKIKEKVLGAEHFSTAITYDNIGAVYQNQGKYKQALEFRVKALTIFKKALGEEHLDTAICYNNIGLVYSDQGEYKKALEFYEKALKIDEQVLGEHPNTAIDYNNIGAVYCKQGEYEKALEYYEKALKIDEKVLGEHPNTAIRYNNIGAVNSDKGEYKQALDFYIKAYRICFDKLGENHPDTKLYFNNMKIVYENSGNTQDFAEWLDEQLNKQEVLV